MRQLQALNVMLSGASVFLTGAPGAGKTYVLNEFVRRAKKQGKRVAVTASTGIAATHIGGSTIHSWSGLGIRDVLSPYDKEVLRSNQALSTRYLTTDVLVIDEISMLHGKRLDMLNDICKLLRAELAPFGGLQVILVGDLFQLPPVNRDSEQDDFIHTSLAWAELAPQICYLTEQHRQGNDQLLAILEAMRLNEIDEWHMAALKERIGKCPPEGKAVTRLYSHNIDVDSINQRYLANLSSETKRFTMQTHGSTNKVEQLVRGLLAPAELELKVGAEVMFVANDYSQGFVNGSRGTVVGFTHELPQVRLLHDGTTVSVEPHSWALEEDGKKRAEVVQLPLRLAWAITIHKSQGMSLDAAEIDLSRSFTPGMGYVALSRVRSLDGVYLTGLNAMAMQLHPAIYEFDKQLLVASAELASTVIDAIDDDQVAEEAPHTIDYDLLDRLRNWRLQRAKSDGIPAYMVAHDSLLEAMAAHPPHSASQLLAMPGIGKRKLELYGDELLAMFQK